LGRVEEAVRARCFEESWVDAGGVRLLLYRLKGVLEIAWVPPEELKSLIDSPLDPDSTLEAFRRLPNLAKLKSECDLISLELPAGGVRYTAVISRKKLRCVPVASFPDIVKSLEVLAKSSDGAAPESDALQRSVLARKTLPLGAELYTPCLVGEVLGPEVVAVGIELSESGYRAVLAGELRDTYAKEEQRPARRKFRKRRARRKRRKKS